MTKPMPHALPACAQAAHDLIQARQTILPKRLLSPGPGEAALQAILTAAAAAPDHGQLLPWRFVLVPTNQRAALGDVFQQALCARDPLATADQLAQAREKAFRAPVLLLLVVDGERGDPDIDLHERLISAGCAVQNMLLMATALGFGSAITSGKALKSAPLRSLFGLKALEHAPCFVSLGTVQSSRPARARPVPGDCVTVLGGAPPSPQPLHNESFHEHHLL